MNIDDYSHIFEITALNEIFTEFPDEDAWDVFQSNDVLVGNNKWQVCELYEDIPMRALRSDAKMIYNSHKQTAELVLEKVAKESAPL